MKPAPFDYARPKTLAEALGLLAEAGGGATVIAGGQTLMPLLNLRMSQPFILVDLADIAELHGIRAETGAIHIGAMTRQNAGVADPLLQRRLPALVAALRHVGHHQTRNRGTLGGSIAFGEPAAELPAVAVGLDARLHLQSVAGARTIAAREFYIGPYATVLEPDEVLTTIEFPDWAADHLPVFGEISRRPGDYALTGLVGAIERDGPRITRAGLAWFGMGPTPVRATGLEQRLAGADADELDFSALADLAISETAPFDDKAASAEYRRTTGRKLAERLLREALAQGAIP
jgi:carbon-monoxide dehydrogenase medium subunit